MVAEPDGQASWGVPLKDEGTAVIVGILADGSVVGQVPAKGRKYPNTVSLPFGKRTARRRICRRLLRTTVGRLRVLRQTCRATPRLQRKGATLTMFAG